MPLGIWDKTFKKFPNASYLNIVKRLSDFLLISFLCKNKARQQNVRPGEVLSSRIIPCSYHLIMFPSKLRHTLLDFSLNQRKRTKCLVNRLQYLDCSTFQIWCIRVSTQWVASCLTSSN
jgi:hypothetical protein